MKRILLTLVLLSTFTLSAQIINKRHTTFKMMQKRTLIVTLLDKNSPELLKLQQKIDKKREI